MSHIRKYINWRSYSTLSAVAVVLLLFLIYSMGTVIVPLILSAIIAISIYPAHKYLVNKGFKEIISALLIVLVLTLLVGSLMFFLSVEGKHIISTVPMEDVPEALQESSHKIEDVIENSTPIDHFDLIKRSRDFMDDLTKMIPEVLYSLKDTVIFIISCPLYIFFMLLYNENFKRAYNSFARDMKDAGRDEILREIKESYRGYMMGMFWVICIVSTLTAVGLWVVGIPFPIFLGLLAGILTIIPYVGVLASAIIPCLLALILKDSIWSFVGVLAVFGIVQFLEGNIITPKIIGDKVNINPLGVIFGLLFLGAIGGVLAMIITIPLLALIQIMAKHSKRWKPLYELLKA